MSKKYNNLQNVSHETIGQRWADMLRRHYGAHAAKNISRDFKCETRTAKAWLSGQSPQLRHFMDAARIIGIAPVLGVLFPETDIHQSMKLHNDLLELRSRIDKLTTELGKRDVATGSEKNRDDGC